MLKVDRVGLYLAPPLENNIVRQKTEENEGQGTDTVRISEEGKRKHIMGALFANLSEQGPKGAR